MRGELDKTAMAAGNSLMIHELERGDMDYLFSATYEELRSLASTVKGAEITENLEAPGATILHDRRAAEAWVAHSFRQ
jgi:hypothetical protein